MTKSIALFVLILSLAFALEQYDTFKEGGCEKLDPKPVDVNAAKLETFLYLSAASKYQFYRYASLNPAYGDMRDFEFYYNFCFHRKVTNNGSGSYVDLYAFGTHFQTYKKTFNSKEKYTDYVSVNPLYSMESERKWVTLTDNQTYAFLSICWTNSDQVGFIVAQKGKELSSDKRKDIEEHAIKIGFDRKQIVFLRYDTCQKF